MTVNASAIATDNTLLDEETIHTTLDEGLGDNFAGASVLVLIPDHTRTLPLPLLFRQLTDVLSNARKLDFMVALGTHPPLSETQLNQLVGVTAEERSTRFKHVGLLNHDWDNPDALTQIGTLEQSQIKDIAGEVWHPSLGGDTPININKQALTYDHIIILGPTFPHEVVGFSGGAKYLFPGISGPEIINKTHWLGALITILDTIGIADTPVRTMIHAAAQHITIPITLISLVVQGTGLAGMFIGDHISAWQAAADLSSKRHIVRVDKPFQQVLSVTPPMYDELWTAAKAMYKLEPAIADGGEIIVYAPHLDTVSVVHGEHIYKTGYHIRDYFLKQWDKFKDFPLSILAHSTHFRGSGSYENGVENARIRVTLASQISRADCERLSLGYMNPDTIDPALWQNHEDAGILFVPKAGEMLYRVKEKR